MSLGVNALGCAYTPRVDWVRLRDGLRRSRDAAGLTLDEAARAAKINRATIHSIENVRREPSLKPDLDTVSRLLTAYDVRLSAFFAEIERSENSSLHSGNSPVTVSAHNPRAEAFPDAGAVSSEDETLIERTFAELEARVRRLENRDRRVANPRRKKAASR